MTTHEDRINAVPTPKEQDQLRKNRRGEAGLDLTGTERPETFQADVPPPFAPVDEKAEAAAAHEERQAAVDAPRAAADKLPGALEAVRQKDQEHEELYAKHEARREDLSRQFGDALFPRELRDRLGYETDNYHKRLLAAHESGHVTLSPEMLDATKELTWMRDRLGFSRERPSGQEDIEAQRIAADIEPAEFTRSTAWDERYGPGTAGPAAVTREYDFGKAKAEERSRVSRGLPLDGQLPSAE